jgi:hypothetical protein
MLGKLCGIRLSACGGLLTRLPICLRSPRMRALVCGLAAMWGGFAARLPRLARGPKRAD